jgi:uncharacterized membrane protein (DUF2068 family)
LHLVNGADVRELTIASLTRQLRGMNREHQVADAQHKERAAALQTTDSKQQTRAHAHDRGLLLIGLFKLGKSLFFFCLGMGALHFLHKDLGDEVLRLATALKFDPESRFVSVMLDKVDLIDAHRLRQISLATFGYSGLALTEGVGLMLEKVWAEYLTLILTISFLPWEMYELIRRPDWFRLGLLLINLAVLGYIVWLLQRKKLLNATSSSRG